MLDKIRQIKANVSKMYLGSIFGDMKFYKNGDRSAAVNSEMRNVILKKVSDIIYMLLQSEEWDKGIDWEKIISDGFSQIDPKILDKILEELISMHVKSDTYIPSILQPAQLKNRLKEVDFKRTKLRVAFAGRTMVGKSSVLNKIAEALKSSMGYIVSHTNAIESIDIESMGDIVFFDTPGYCDEQRGWSIERLIEIYKIYFDVIVLVVSDGIDSQAKQIYRAISDIGKKCIIVQNKSEFLRDSDYADPIVQLQLDSIRKEMIQELGSETEIFFTYCIDTKSRSFRECATDAVLYKASAEKFYSTFGDDVKKLKLYLSRLAIQRNKFIAESVIKGQIKNIKTEILDNIRINIQRDMKNTLISEFWDKFVSMSGSCYGVLEKVKENLRKDDFSVLKYQEFIKEKLQSWPGVKAEWSGLILMHIITYLHEQLILSFNIYKNYSENREGIEAAKDIKQEQGLRDVLTQAGIIVEIFNKIYEHKREYIKKYLEQNCETYFKKNLAHLMKKIMSCKITKANSEDQKFIDAIQYAILYEKLSDKEKELFCFSNRFNCREEVKYILQIDKLVRTIFNTLTSYKKILDHVNTDDLIILNIYISSFVNIITNDLVKIPDGSNYCIELEMINANLNKLHKMFNILCLGIFKNLKTSSVYNDPTVPHIYDSIQDIVCEEIGVSKELAEEVSNMAVEYKKGYIVSMYTLDRNIFTRFLIDMIYSNTHVRKFLRESLYSFECAVMKKPQLKDEVDEIVKIVRSVTIEPLEDTIYDVYGDNFNDFIKKVFETKVDSVIHNNCVVLDVLLGAVSRKLIKCMDSLSDSYGAVDKFKIIDTYMLEGMVEKFKLYTDSSHPTEFANVQQCAYISDNMQFWELVKKADKDTSVIKEFLVELKERGIAVLEDELYINKDIYIRFLVDGSDTFKFRENLLSDSMQLKILDYKVAITDGNNSETYAQADQKKLVCNAYTNGLAFSQTEGIILSNLYDIVKLSELNIGKKSFNMFKNIRKKINYYLSTMMDSQRVFSLYDCDYINSNCVEQIGLSGKMGIARVEGDSKKRWNLFLEPDLYKEMESWVITCMKESVDHNVEYQKEMETELSRMYLPCISGFGWDFRAGIKMKRNIASDVTSEKIIKFVNKKNQQFCHVFSDQLLLQDELEISDIQDYIKKYMFPIISKTQVEKYCYNLTDKNTLKSKKIDGYDIPSYDGYILHHLARNDNIEAIKLAIRKNSIPDTLDSTGNTVLHVGVINDAQIVVRYLVCMTDSDIEIQDRYGNTALISALYHQKVDMTKILICAGSSLTKATGNMKSALQVMLEVGQYETLQAVIETGIMDYLPGFYLNKQSNCSAKIYFEKRLERLISSYQEQTKSYIDDKECKYELLDQLNLEQCKSLLTILQQQSEVEIKEFLILLESTVLLQKPDVDIFAMVQGINPIFANSDMLKILIKITKKLEKLCPDLLVDCIYQGILKYRVNLLNVLSKYKEMHDPLHTILNRMNKCIKKDKIREIVNFKDVLHNNPLIYSVACSCTSKIVKNVMKLGGNVDAIDSMGRTILHSVVLANMQDAKSVKNIITLFLNKGVNGELRDKDGKTYIDYMKQKNLCLAYQGGYMREKVN